MIRRLAVAFFSFVAFSEANSLQTIKQMWVEKLAGVGKSEATIAKFTQAFEAEFNEGARDLEEEEEINDKMVDEFRSMLDMLSEEVFY